MKKIFIASTIFLSTLAFSIEGNRYVYEDTSAAQDTTAGDTPAGSGDPVPVNQYIPVLVLAAVGLAAYYGREKRITQ